MNDFPGTNAVAESPSGPVQTGMRASDAERENTSTQLADAMADGRLDHDEYLTRLDAAYAAKTRAELTILTEDLAPASAPSTPPGAPSAAGSENIVALLGSAERRGRWLVEPRTNVSTLLGSIELDMRSADFAASDVTVQIAAILGSVEITVPPGVHVRDRTSSVLGSVDVSSDAAGATAGTRTVTLSGAVMLGSVSVKSAPAD